MLEILYNPLAHRLWKNAQIMVLLKYINSIFRSLELIFTNTKLYMELNWTKNSVMSDAVGNTKFQITKTELYVPVVTLKTADHNKLNELLETAFKTSVFWNEYKNNIERVAQAQNDNNFKRIMLDASYPGENSLFAIRFDENDDSIFKVERNSHKKYFLLRVDIKDPNVLIDSRNCYDQAINDELRKYDEVRNIMIGRGEDYELDN